MPIHATVNGTGTGAVSAATVPVPPSMQREVAMVPLIATEPQGWIGKFSNRADNDEISRLAHQFVEGQTSDVYEANHPRGSVGQALVVASDWVGEQLDAVTPEGRERLANWRATINTLMPSQRVEGSTVQTVMLPVWLSDP